MVKINDGEREEILISLVRKLKKDGCHSFSIGEKLAEAQEILTFIQEE